MRIENPEARAALSEEQRALARALEALSAQERQLLEHCYAALLLDVAPGARFPAHRHEAAEECYVISGHLVTCGRRLGPGDFIHADAHTDHGELWTDVGCQVLLVVPPEPYMISA